MTGVRVGERREPNAENGCRMQVDVSADADHRHLAFLRDVNAEVFAGVQHPRALWHVTTSCTRADRS